MPLFVDHAGLNILISQELKDDVLSPDDRNIIETTTDKSLFSGESSNPAQDCWMQSDLDSYTASTFPVDNHGSGFSFWINLETDAINTRVVMSTLGTADDADTTDFNPIQISFDDGFIKFKASKERLNYKEWFWSVTMSNFVNTWNHVYITWDNNMSNDPVLYVNTSSITDHGSSPSTVGSALLGIGKIGHVGAVFLFDSPIEDDANKELNGSLQNFIIIKGQSGTLPSQTEMYNSGKPFEKVSEITLTGTQSLVDFWLLGNEVEISSLNAEDNLNNSVTSLAGEKTKLHGQGNIVVKTGVNGVTQTPRMGNFPGQVTGARRLAALNTHRNGPYGLPSWRQTRACQNPVTRNNVRTNTFSFVTQGSLLPNSGGRAIRQTYSKIFSFNEPPVTQKAHPLIWNVGRHFKDDDGFVHLDNPQKFSILSSYSNKLLGFANEDIDIALNFNPDEQETEYVAIKEMYLDNGLNKLDSPLTYWEFLQYRETVFPLAKHHFRLLKRDRPNFKFSFEHDRAERKKTIGGPTVGDFGYPPVAEFRFQSAWPLDPSSDFLTAGESRSGPHQVGPLGFTQRNQSDFGLLQNINSHFYMFLSGYSVSIATPNIANNYNSVLSKVLAPYPTYNRRHSLKNTASVVSPSGMLISETSSVTGLGVRGFLGDAFWDAGNLRQIIDSSGSYVSSPKQPTPNSYLDYSVNMKNFYKNYSTIPEFKMSDQLVDYKNGSSLIELDMLEVPGGITSLSSSNNFGFYEIYSNTDFLKNFEIIDDDHEEFINAKVLSLRCKAVKKFLPYKGFYPCERTVEVAKQFYNSHKNFIKNKTISNTDGVNELNDFNFGIQPIMTPLFSPGILFNSIKSGIAVDFPIAETTCSAKTATNIGTEHLIQNDFDRRIPFEALVEPAKYLSGYDIGINEPHPSGNLEITANWDGGGDNLYPLVSNNFLAETINFFLPNGQLTSLVSKAQKDINEILENGKVYGMRVKMRRSMDNARPAVYHSASLVQIKSYFPPQDIIRSGSNATRETFTMYSRPSAFGPPSFGETKINVTGSDLLNFDELGFHRDNSGGSVNVVGPGSSSTISKDSRFGYNFPFTPPYYHGEAWCDIWITGSGQPLTIPELQSKCSTSFTRFDASFYTSPHPGVDSIAESNGPQSFNKINQNAVQLSSSLNIFGIGSLDAEGGGGAGSFVVDTGVDENNRWIIQTKFETPMLNFNHVSSSDHITLPLTGAETTPRGIWHQYGRIPKEEEGVFLEVGPIPQVWQKSVGVGGTKRTSDYIRDLSAHLGFSNASTKIGKIAQTKTISEAVVAVPFISESGRKKFFKLDPFVVDVYKGKGTEEQFESLTSGPPQQQIGRSVLNQLNRMKKFVLPPAFDFLHYEGIEPIAMYIFEFSQTLTRQDLSDIWQNLPPDIADELEVSEVAITHPLLKKELLGQGGELGNQTIDMPKELKWMVFKAKERAASNYFDKTVLKKPRPDTGADNQLVNIDDQGIPDTLQYNWPYDFFSLVELVKIDAEVEFGNLDQEDIDNYIDHIPSWRGINASREKIQTILGGIEDNPIADIVPIEEYEEPPTPPVNNNFTKDIEDEGLSDWPLSDLTSWGDYRDAYISIKDAFNKIGDAAGWNGRGIDFYGEALTVARTQLESRGAWPGVLPGGLMGRLSLWVAYWTGIQEVTLQGEVVGASSTSSSNDDKLSDREWMKKAWYERYKKYFNEPQGIPKTKEGARRKHRNARDKAEKDVRNQFTGAASDYKKSQFNAKWETDAAREAHEDKINPTSRSVLTFYFPYGSEGPNKKRIPRPSWANY